MSTKKPGFMCNKEIQDKKRLFEQKVEQHKSQMEANPFSDRFKTSQATKLLRDDPNYGKPLAGSKSEKRALKAAGSINREVAQLCNIIFQEGQQLEDGTAVIPFGELFQLYTVISSKLVGSLLRGRKHGFIDFEGETLFQRRDDFVPVFLAKPIQEIRDSLANDTDFEVGICHKDT